jgi:hypothetical protein
MKRKIAAIFAADIAGYSWLVAEDAEETLRRLGSYRQRMGGFVARCGGRVLGYKKRSTARRISCAPYIPELLKNDARAANWYCCDRNL